MIGVQDLRKGTTFMGDDGSLYVVLDHLHNKQGRGNATIKTKLRNLRTGATIEKSFQSGGRVRDVQLETRTIQFLYSDGDLFYFMDTETYEQPVLSADLLGNYTKYLKEGTMVALLVYEGEPLHIELPTTVDLKVIDTSPWFKGKGDSASGSDKPATLENGTLVNVPPFIVSGDIIRVDTRTGGYVTRV